MTPPGSTGSTGGSGLSPRRIEPADPALRSTMDRLEVELGDPFLIDPESGRMNIRFAAIDGRPEASRDTPAAKILIDKRSRSDRMSVEPRLELPCRDGRAGNHARAVR